MVVTERGGHVRVEAIYTILCPATPSRYLLLGLVLALPLGLGRVTERFCPRMLMRSKNTIV